LWYLAGHAEVYGKFAIFRETALRRQLGDFFRQHRLRDRGRKGFLDLLGKLGTQSQWPGSLGFAAAREQIGAPTKVLDSFTISGYRVERLRVNGATHTDFDPLPLLLEKLLQQESSTQFRMNHAEKLESDPVVSAEINWQCSRTGTANQTDGGVIPLRVCHLPGGHLPLRYFT
jgi:hypothetical protein